MRLFRGGAQVVDSVAQLLETGHKNGREMVTNLVAVELAWLNTSHPNFIGGSRAVLQAMTRLQVALLNTNACRKAQRGGRGCLYRGMGPDG